MNILRVPILAGIVFALVFFTDWLQRTFYFPSEAILVIRNGLTPLIIFALCVFITLFLMVNWRKINDFYYYSRLILMVLAIIICLFDFSYFTESSYVSRTFLTTSETSLSEAKEVWIYATKRKQADYFHYELTFSNGKVVRLKNELQPYTSKELFNLDRIIRNHVFVYKLEDFSEEEIQDMSKYELEIVNDHKFE